MNKRAYANSVELLPQPPDDDGGLERMRVHA
jgi:hypothetical protein